MSADPTPISEPLLAAGVATLMAGLFVCADTALTSLSRARLAALAQEAKPRYRKALHRAVIRRPTLQARYLAGRVIALCFAAGGTSLWLAQQPLEISKLAAIAAGAILAVGMVVEASAALGRRAADWLVPPFVLLLQPLEFVIAPFALVTSGVGALFKWRRRANPRITEAEVEIMVDQGERSGMLEQEPAELIRNVLEFSELTARDAMIPRTRITAIKLGTPISAVLQTITESGHSRYPVYREEMDDIFGLLYAKDLFRVIRKSWRPPALGEEDGSDTPSQGAAELLEIVREPVKFVSESQPLSILLGEMRQDRQHLAIVVDEFGGTSGIVTLEDVLEEIVGDIQDEFDSEEAPIVHDGQGRLIADAAVPISDLSAYLGSELDPDGQYDSLGGMLTAKVGGIPKVGTKIPVDGMSFIVHESDEKHISKVEIVRAAPDASGEHRAAS